MCEALGKIIAESIREFPEASLAKLEEGEKLHL